MGEKSSTKTEWGEENVCIFIIQKHIRTHTGCFFRFYTRFNEEKECRTSERKEKEKVQYGHREN